MMTTKAALLDHHATIKAVGVSFRSQLDGEGRALSVGTPIDVYPQPQNPFDANALALCVDGHQVGFVPAGFAARIAADPDLAGRILHGSIPTGTDTDPSITYAPDHAIDRWGYTTDGGATWHRITTPTLPVADVHGDIARIRVAAILNGKTVPQFASAIRAVTVDGQPHIAWDPPVVGFKFCIDTIGRKGSLPYTEQVAA